MKGKKKRKKEEVKVWLASNVQFECRIISVNKTGAVVSPSRSILCSLSFTSPGHFSLTFVSAIDPFVVTPQPAYGSVGEREGGGMQGAVRREGRRVIV